MFVPYALSAGVTTVIAAVAGLVGAAIGGGFTLWGTIITARAQRKSAAEQALSQAGATALLMQDDFLHYQVTLARSLDACRWWSRAQLLPTQATIADRKTVWAAIKGNERTAIVAGAQGWMDYLINTRGLQPADQDSPPLSAPDAQTMRDTWRKLEHGREALANLAGRDFAPFQDAFNMEKLTVCKTVEMLEDQGRCQ